MKSNKYASLTDFLQLTSGNLTKAVLKSFIDKNFFALTASEKNSFFVQYSSKNDPDLIDLAPLQAEIADALAPKTLDEFLTLTFITVVTNGCDLKEVLVNPLVSAEFESALKQAGLALSPLSLIHICRCRRYAVCRSRWSPNN
eukprot:TRINITY_DN25467_c0_g1_i2.p1 TRINITY_DN25467_c0_g1~~TRINITY_DN25467_c0_g1_i2.p1  ORF type:complete len:143 (+),score=14.77 TRINITY_DN25467_c0_g1_i2:123-551(+)